MLLVVGLAGVIVSVVWAGEWFVGAIALLAAGAALRAFGTPTATRARVKAERAWAATLPFQLEGYFETLAAAPRVGMHLVIEITWSAGTGPAPETVRSVVGVLDTDARVDSQTSGTVRMRSGRISGNTSIRSNNAIVKRNTRVVRYVHRLAQNVLLPLHRDCGIARVVVARDG